MPSKNAGADYRALSDKYGASNEFLLLLHSDVALPGELVYLDVLGQPILLLGSHDAALDLLEKRSALYSDRVHSPMVDL